MSASLPRQIDRLLVGYDRWYRWRLAAIFLLAAVQTLVVVARPMPVKALVEEGSATHPGWLDRLAGMAGADVLLVFLGLALLVEGLAFALRLAEENRSTALSERLIRAIRGDIAGNLLRGPYRAVAGLGVGRVIAAATGDVEVIQRLIKDVVIGASIAALQLVAMLAVILTLHPPLFWVLLGEIAGLSVLIGLYARWRKRAFLEQMHNQERFIGWTAGLQQRSLDLRFSTARGLVLLRTLGLARRLWQRGMLLWRRQTLYYAGVELFVGLASALCLVLLFLSSRDAGQDGGQNGGQPLGTVLVFLYYAAMIFPCLARVGEAVPLMTDARNAYDRLSSTLGAMERPAPVPGAEEQVAPVPGAGEGPDERQTESARFGAITLDRVGLRSDTGDWLLRDLSLTIAPGEHVALFGESGSGKSTLLSVILGLARPDAGEVRIGDRPMTALTLFDRKRFFCFQRSTPAFFPGTVAENMAPGLPPDRVDWPRLLDDCRMAGRLAGAADGLDTPMTERGEPFSQGEGQRIGIARAFLTPAPCIVLDEALNSLDEAGELAITAALRRHLAGRTLIVISHRRSVAETFGRMIEVKRGGLVSG